ncbi:CAP domain-containing protein [Halorientalis brevis]|uniref:CAP domain-containing protein n=1 Tax=Halorientalis brevis TaxID=1126241 RepID=A0ABD6CD14_9EURY|nr:CAP domain-containing protein [Halorientalis brevis]
MVNKAALSVLGVIVLVSMGVGILIGMQLGGTAGTQTNNGGGGGGATPIPDGGTGTPVPTAGPGSSPNGSSQNGGPAGDQETTVSVREFEDDAIETEIGRLINEERESRGLDELEVTGKLSSEVTTMSRNHSKQMAEERKLSHTIEGQSSLQRYRQNDLYSTCIFLSNGGGHNIDADGNKLETIAYAKAGRTYEHNNQYYYHENNTAVASAVVDRWFENQFLRPRLLYENANAVGVGVEITESGDVYATANVC